MTQGAAHMDLTLRTYLHGTVEVTEHASAEQIAAALDLPDVLLWVDVLHPDATLVTTLAERLHLHPVAVAEALEPHTRPRFSRYEHHLFLNCYLMTADARGDRVAASEVTAFLTDRLLLTLRRAVSPAAERLDTHLRAHQDLLAQGVQTMLWSLLDVIVDSQYDTAQRVDRRLDALETLVFGEEPARRIQQRAFQLRKDLIRVRRLAAPMREVVTSVLHSPQLPEALRPYMADTYDHTLRVADWADSSRDLVASLLDAHLNIQSNRMNLVMKKVTSWAAIIAVPTLITGFFGQNLLFWGYGTWWGTALSGGLIVASAAVLYWLFRRNDWL